MSHSKEPMRRNAPGTIDDAIEQDTLRSLRLSANNPHRINKRLEELKEEWDIDQSLELNAAALTLTGLVLGFAVNKKWLMLPAVVTLFMAQHAIQGWCPPLFLLRKSGIRTRSEINREKFALKLLRGDFGQQYTNADLLWEALKSDM